MGGKIKDKKPNFLFIGPDKSGSTWLYKLLKSHPQVFLPKSKELFYFDYFYNKGDNWYLKFFKDAKPIHKIIAEISHDYLFSNEACERIYETLPNVKLMVCLREPIERALSSYLYLIKQGRTNLSFSEAIRNIDELIEHGLYYKQLEKFYNKFGKERVLWKLFDELKSNPVKYANDIFNFLEIEKINIDSSLLKKSLPAAAPRSLLISKLIHAISWKVREIGLPEVISKVKNNKLINTVLFRSLVNDEKPIITEEDNNYLKNIFFSDLLELSKLLEFDFITYWGYDENDK